MQVDDRTLALELLAKAYPQASLEGIQHLAGDASGRRFLRLYLHGAPSPTIILMLLKRRLGPPAAGRPEVTQDDSFVILIDFFKQHGINVPNLIYDARSQHALLVEDVGDLVLWRFVLDDKHPAITSFKSKYHEDPTLTLFKNAADIIHVLQRIPPQPESLPFQRSLEFEHYQTESRRFIEHYLKPHKLLKQEYPQIEAALDQICQEVASQPRALVHRDFMPWNLLVGPDGRLTVIDFQDTLIASYAYDLISLLHDRDLDFSLGAERCRAVFVNFRDTAGFDRCFGRHYLEALLQRSFRLVGQFCLLSQNAGLPIYRNWVPGCLRRIGQVLAMMPEKRSLLKVLCRALPEVESGAKAPLTWIDL